MTQNRLTRENDSLEHALLSNWIHDADIGMCVVDDTSRLVMLNAAAARMLGVDSLKVLNQPLKALLGSIDGSPKLIQWLATPGFDGQKHVSRKTADIQLDLLLKCSSVRTSTAERFKVVVITDITELVATQKLEECHKRQWEALNAGVVVSDARLPDMPIVYVNSAFERMTGYARDELIGHNCRIFQHNNNQQPALENIRQAIRNETNGHAVLVNYRKDGSQFLNELFIAPIRDAKRVTTHFIGVQHVR